MTSAPGLSSVQTGCWGSCDWPGMVRASWGGGKQFKPSHKTRVNAC